MKSLQAIRLLAAEQYGADLHGAMHVMNLGADVINPVGSAVICLATAAPACALPE